MWTTSVCAQFIVQGTINTAAWGNPLTIASLTASMTVNALVTGLIVFRIFKVFREVKDVTTSNEKSLGITGGRKLHSIIFIIIESGMALFATQLGRLVISAIAMQSNTEDAADDAFELIAGIHQILNVVISSVIELLDILLTISRLGYNAYHHPGAGVDEIVFPRRAIFSRSCG